MTELFIAILSTHHTSPVQPSELEIRREVEALKDIRRRSSAQGGPGAIPLDPDLPELTPSPSPHSSSAWSASLGSDEQEPDLPEDPSHLFWVPARLHPELAPGEFRAFLKEHARDGGAGLQRANSASSSSSTLSLGRKKSMLSRQYRPSESDGVEDEHVVPIRRNKSSLYSNPAPQLTIGDLQKLEELAEEASMSDDPTKLRSMLRRSLSLTMSPSPLDQLDNVPEVDESDSPIIVPRPNQILRRAARTKIRKPNLQGDGGGHRFASTRRGGQRAQTIATSDGSEHDHEDLFTQQQAQSTEIRDDRPISYTDEAFIFDAYADRRDSASSGSHERSEDDLQEISFISSPPSNLPSIRRSTSPPLEPPLSSSSSPPVLYQPTPQHLIPVPASSSIIPPSRTPSPSFSETGSTEVASQTPSIAYTSSPSDAPIIRREEPPPVQVRPYPSPSPVPARKDKEKKSGLFGKWGSKDDKKKGSKGESAREKEAREREKEKESGFFGSLFGSKKKHEESSPGLLHGSSGPATAAALLGASKSSKSYITSPSPQLTGAYARYPIHVERAVYRLSHIKLANPRRPLYEQVLISNLMFWYLGVINKAQNGGVGAGVGVAAGSQGQSLEVVQPDKESQEREQRERAEKERLEREREKERERTEQNKREGGRKGSLTKAPKPGGEGSGSRRAEMPVRGPQYESQHRAIEQEYSYGGTSNPGPSTSSPIRVGSAPPMSSSGSSGYHQYNNHRMSPSPMMQGRSGSPPLHHPHHAQQGVSSSPPVHQGMHQGVQQGQYYYNHEFEGHGQSQIPHSGMSYSLPPGAMMPLQMDKSWFSSTGPGQPASLPSSLLDAQNPYNYSLQSMSLGQQQSSSSSQSPRRQRSPSPKNLANPGLPKHPTATLPGGRLQGRSLSATVAPPQQVLQNGKLKKKHASAAAVPAQRRSSDGGGTYGDEDLPLAVWQQQQRAGGRR